MVSIFFKPTEWLGFHPYDALATHTTEQLNSLSQGIYQEPVWKMPEFIVDSLDYPLQQYVYTELRKYWNAKLQEDMLVLNQNRIGWDIQRCGGTEWDDLQPHIALAFKFIRDTCIRDPKAPFWKNFENACDILQGLTSMAAVKRYWNEILKKEQFQRGKVALKALKGSDLGCFKRKTRARIIF